MESRRPSLLAQALEPLASSLWILFILWTAIVAAVWMLGFGEAELSAHIANAGLKSALSFLLASLDAVWVTLAAANVYLALAEAEGLSAARRWAAIVIVGGWLAAALSTRTGFPLGPLRYSARLGMRIGPVPFSVPLLWLVLVSGGRALALRLAPRMRHTRVAFAAGVLAALTEANLEPLAWRARAFWIWQSPGHPSIRNHAAWLVVSFAFAFLLRETHAASASSRGLPRPVLVLIIFNAVFLLTHAARFIQR